MSGSDRVVSARLTWGFWSGKIIHEACGNFEFRIFGFRKGKAESEDYAAQLLAAIKIIIIDYGFAAPM